MRSFQQKCVLELFLSGRYILVLQVHYKMMMKVMMMVMAMTVTSLFSLSSHIATVPNSAEDNSETPMVRREVSEWMNCITPCLANWSCQSKLLALLNGLVRLSFADAGERKEDVQKTRELRFSTDITLKKAGPLGTPLQGSFIVRATRGHETINHTILKFFSNFQTLQTFLQVFMVPFRWTQL